MTNSAADPQPVEMTPAVGVRWRIAGSCTFLLSLVAVGLLAASDSTRFAAEADRSRLLFGRPFGWLRQDQSAFDPPAPGATKPWSPWEHPVSVEIVPLAISVAIVMALLLAAWWCATVLRARWS